MSKVLVERELLERLQLDAALLKCEHWRSQQEIRAILAQPAEAEGVSGKHEISCWKCHEMTSLETRNEMDGCCWACGEEIDLDDYLIKAMDKRDEHYAALAAVTAPQGKFAIGDRVKKASGSEWVGKVVGWYRTSLTPEGYAVESEAHAGSVQIYPAKALEAVE